MAKEYWLIIIANIMFGSIVSGGQFFINSGLSVYEFMLYSFIIETLLLLTIVFFKREYLIKRGFIGFFIIYGLIGALQSASQYIPLFFGVSVAVVAFLIYTQFIWTTLIGRLFLKERLTKRKIWAIFFGLAGIFFLIDIFNASWHGSIIGISVALAGGLLLSLWIVWGRISGLNKQHFVTTDLGYAGFTSVWLLLFWPVANHFVKNEGLTRLSVNFPPKFWLFIFIFTLITTIPHLLFYKGVQKVTAFASGIMTLLEPLSAALLAAFFLSQPLTANVALGGAFIIFSNYLAIGKDQYA